MPLSRDFVSWVWLGAAVACLVIGLFPQWHEWDDPATGERVSERRLGLWFSPLHHTVERTSLQGSWQWRAWFQWLSWSTLVIVVGVGCFEMFRMRRRRIANITPERLKEPKL